MNAYSHFISHFILLVHHHNLHKLYNQCGIRHNHMYLFIDKLWFIIILLTELVSYMYPIYVHYMYILDVLSFPFGSRHRPYWDCEVRSKSEWRVSCIAPTVLWLLYNTDHNWQIYRGHTPWQVISRNLFRQLNQGVVRFVKTLKLGWCSPPA